MINYIFLDDNVEFKRESNTQTLFLAKFRINYDLKLSPFKFHNFFVDNKTKLY